MPIEIKKVTPEKINNYFRPPSIEEIFKKEPTPKDLNLYAGELNKFVDKVRRDIWIGDPSIIYDDAAAVKFRDKLVETHAQEFRKILELRNWHQKWITEFYTRFIDKYNELVKSKGI